MIACQRQLHNKIKCDFCGKIGVEYSITRDNHEEGYDHMVNYCCDCGIRQSEKMMRMSELSAHVPVTRFECRK